MNVSSGGRRSGRKHKRLMAEINVVPYIDVMLVLLIIFMVTAPLMTQGVKVNLPKAAATSLPPEKQAPIIVSVNQQGDYFVSIATEPKQPVSATMLSNQVQQALQQDPQRKVYVRGDQQVPYGTMMQAMVLLQQAGATGVGLITDPSDGS